MKSIKLMSVSILAVSLIAGLNAGAEEVKPQSAPPVVSTESKPVVENGSQTQRKLSKKEQKKLARAQKRAEKKALKKKTEVKS